MRKTLAKILGITISIILIFQNITVFAASNKTDLQNEQSEIDEKIKQLQEEQEEIHQNKSDAMKAVEDLIYQISDAEEEVSDLEDQIEELQNQIASREKDIETKQQEYNEQEDLLDARVITLYKSGNTSYLEILLNASSMSDFLSRYYLAEELIKCDKELMNSIIEQKQNLENEKAQLEEDKKSLDSSLAEKESITNQLKNLKNQKQSYVTQLTAEEKENQAEIEKMEEDRKEIDAKLKKIAEEEAKKSNTQTVVSTPSASGYISPIPGTSSKSITCGFYGYSNHGGADFGGHYGEPVLAVKDGTVVISEAKSGSIKNYDSNGKVIGSYSSYGEYIIINHHDGTMTLYAHGKPGSRLVKAGDEVKQGQQIMSVGNTGNVLPRPTASNYKGGAHLHFEVRINGSTRVNPAPYLP